MAKINLEVGQTIIDSNGPGRILPIEALLTALATETLDPTFEKYGDFCEIDPEGFDRSEPLYPAGTWSFFGNFHTCSHVFNIATRDHVLAGRLMAAIAANKATTDYATAKIEYEAAEAKRLAEIAERDRKRDEERERRYGRFAA